MLEQLIRERHMTFEECTDYIEKFAREHGEVGTLGTRHLQRLAAGCGPKGTPLGPVRPATARLLEHIFGAPIDTLLSAPTTTSAVTRSSELAQRLRASSRVDAELINLARGQLADLRRVDRRLGAIVGYQEAAAKAVQWKSLYRHCLTPSIRAQLGKLLSELHTLAGWQALDLARPEQAWHHYERAKEFSRESANPAHWAYAAAEQSFVLLDLGEPAWAVQLLDHTAAEAQTAVPPMVRAWLAAAQGEAFAANHQSAESASSFDQARSLLTTDQATIEGPYVSLNELHLTRWQGHALTITNTAAAVPVLQSANSDVSRTSVRARAALHIDLATAYRASKAFEQADFHATQALQLANKVGSQRNLRRLTAIPT